MMKRLTAIFVTALAVGMMIPGAQAIERVYLRSGSTLVAASHKDRGDVVEVVLQSESKVFINSNDIDKITVETSAPIDLSTLDFDPQSILPDVSDPLNAKWLKKPPASHKGLSRLYLDFAEQIRRGIKVPLAKTLADVKFARTKKVRELEFVDRKFFLGMDMQYHEDPGLRYLEAFDQLLDLETTRNIKAVRAFIKALRKSKYDPRKEQIVAAAIKLRDRLDPDFNQMELQREEWTAQAKPVVNRRRNSE